MRKRILAMLLTAAMVLTTIQTPAYANEQTVSNLTNPEGAFLETLDQDSYEKTAQPLGLVDIFSDEGFAAAEMSEEEWLESEGCGSEWEDAEEEFEEYLAQCNADQSVSENGVTVSENDIEDMIAAEGLGYATEKQAAEYLRKQFVARKSSITIKLANSKDANQKQFKKIVNRAMSYEKGTKPNEGDYIYWAFKGWAYRQAASSSETVTYYLKITWRSTASQEKFVDQKIAGVVASLGLKDGNKTDKEKATLIYDYIMDLVTYDHYHFKNNPSYGPMYTVYNAFQDHYVVCQSYALLFYRLAWEAGLEARLIAGNDDNKGQPTHGWDIVKIGDKFYNVDATWDDETPGRRSYFLKSQADFKGHTRNKDYATKAFMAEFPMSDISYPTAEFESGAGAVALINKPNLTGTFFDVLTNKVLDITANGKAKFFLFFDSSEAGTKVLMQDLADSVLLNNSGVDVYLFDILSMDEYEDYFLANGVDPSRFTTSVIAKAYYTALGMPSNFSVIANSNTVNSLLYDYEAMIGMAPTKKCFGVIVDSQNNVRYAALGTKTIPMFEQAYDMIKAGNGQNTLSMAAPAVSQAANNKLNISWTPVSGASKYHVYIKKNGGNYVCVGSTAANSYQAQIDGAATYTVKILAGDSSKKIAQSAEKAVVTRTILKAKGSSISVDGNNYKVLSCTGSNNTVAFSGVTNKNTKEVIIPATIKYEGLTYKVTQVANKALNGKKKVVTVLVGGNVTTIGNQAFSGCSKLSNLVIDSKKLKKVGKNAFKGIKNGGYIYVPAAKLSKYKKLFHKKGIPGNTKIKK